MSKNRIAFRSQAEMTANRPRLNCGQKVTTHFLRDRAWLRIVSLHFLYHDNLFFFFFPFALSPKTSRGQRPPSPSSRVLWRRWAFRRASSEPFGGCWQLSTTWAQRGPAKVCPSCPASLGCWLSLHEMGRGESTIICVSGAALWEAAGQSPGRMQWLGFSSKPSRAAPASRTFCGDGDALCPRRPAQEPLPACDCRALETQLVRLRK